jgi:hypothetical protein
MSKRVSLLEANGAAQRIFGLVAMIEEPIKWIFRCVHQFLGIPVVCRVGCSVGGTFARNDFDIVESSVQKSISISS